MTYTIIIDTETTGLTHEPDARPWQIAALVLDADLTQIASCVIEGCPDVMNENAQEALSFSSKTVADIQRLPPLSQSLPALISFLNALPNAKLTAYNIPFDRVMLERVGITTKIPWAPCVMETAKTIMVKSDRNPLPWNDYFQDYKIPKLTEAAAFFNVTPHEPAHRAIGDARTTAAIVRAMKGL